MGTTALEGGEGSEWTLCLLSAGWSIQPVHGVDPLLGAWQPRLCRPVSSSIPPPAPILPCPLPGMCSSPPPQVGQLWRAGVWGGRGVEQALRCLVSPEGRAEGRAELCAPWCRKDIPGPCFSNLLCSLLFVFFPSTYVDFVFFTSSFGFIIYFLCCCSANLNIKF